MVEFLSNINDYIAAIAVILASLPLLIIARDLTIDWAKKLIYLSIIVAIWHVFFTPYAVDLQTLVIIILTIMPYQLITESTAILIEQVFLFMVTLNLFRWMFKVENPHEGSISTGKGFSSRPLR